MKYFAILFSFVLTLSAIAKDILDHLVIETNKGPIVIAMDTIGTPEHFSALSKLVDMGIYTGVAFSYAEEDYYIQMGGEEFREFGFYPEQAELIKSLPNEITDFQHYAGAVTMPGSPDDELQGGEYLFTVMLDRAEDLDKQQTIIGFVVKGLNLLKESAKGKKVDEVLTDPLVIQSAIFKTKKDALAYYSDNKNNVFNSQMSHFSQYSFLCIILIQLIIFYGKKKIDPQILDSLQIIVFLIAAFSVMAQLYPLVADSTLFSLLLVGAMLLCFKILASLERSRGLTK